MKQVAREAGVSQATVSLSLSNHPRIPDGTRERIQRVAHRLGYRPNPFVTALMRSRRSNRPLPASPVLAFVCMQDKPDAWRNSPSATIRRILDGAVARAAARGYSGQEVWLHKDGMSNERFSEILRVRGIHGLLLGPLAPGAPLPALQWRHFSVVRVGVPLASLPMRCVCHDNYGGSLRAVRECLQLGYRRPALILLNSHNRNLEGRWEAGFLAGIQELPPSRRIAPWVVEDWPSAPALRLRLQAHRPDVLITPGHRFILPELTALGLRVPRDLGLASLACQETETAVGGIEQGARQIGSGAVDLLVDLVERHDRGLADAPSSLMMAGHWRMGATLRSPAAAPGSKRA